MILVLSAAVSIICACQLFGAPRRLQTGLLAALACLVILVQLALPEGNPLKTALGGDLKSWLVALGIAGVVLAYAAFLRSARKRAAAPEGKNGGEARKGPLSETELERYARHIVLREIGGAGQKKLREAKALVIGAGGLGSSALLYLAAAGVGKIGIVDDDSVSLSNLQRQVIHSDADIGMPKVFSAQKAIKALNPDIAALAYNRRLGEEDAKALIEDYDIVVDGSDSYETRAVVNKACVELGVPLVFGAVSQWEGQVALFDPSGEGPCYSCVFPKAPGKGQAMTCAEAGIVGALPGVIGSMMALEAIKRVAGAGTPLSGEMLIYDALHGETRKIRIMKSRACGACGGRG